MTFSPIFRRLPSFAALVLGAFIATSLHAQTGTPLSAQKSQVTTPQVQAELMAHAPQGVTPGASVWVGLSLRHQPHWHTYWKNSGDSGLPTQLEWTLPVGVLAGDIAWPLPKKLALGKLINYGYEGEVLLPVPLIITPQFKPSPINPELAIGLKASWLVCRTECIPEEGEFFIKIPVKSSTALNAAAFSAAQAAQPTPLKAGSGSAITVQGQTLKIAIANLPASLQGQTLEAFPELAAITNPSAPWKQAWQGSNWSAELPLAAERSARPRTMALVLTHKTQGWRIELPVKGTWPKTLEPGALPVTGAARSPLANAPANESTGTPLVAAPISTSLIAALLGALLGGLILNLMPCVFPVLAIKVLGFTRHANDQHHHRLSGLAYTAGVLLSFLLLGALLLALRAAGESLGWGFQLQSPAIVAALAALFTLIGLNFAGVFEFSQMLPSKLATLQARHPVLDAFLTGVLAVAVASPCSAPFMGASLGLAVTLPAAQALLIFVAIGLGLALPFLLASFVPAFARSLPKPGAWMDAFRKLMAFPMFATVAWLVWVLGQQSSIDGAGALLALLVAFSAVVWSLSLHGRTRWVLASLLGALFVWALLAVGPYVTASDEPATESSPHTALSPAPGWQAWSPERAAQLLAEGRPVFIDFTAAWCVTCQYNKKTTLADARLLADLQAKNVALLRADWTRRDPAITRALAQLGRNGVPVYVLQKKGSTPMVLSEIISVSEVREALAKL